MHRQTKRYIGWDPGAEILCPRSQRAPPSYPSMWIQGKLWFSLKNVYKAISCLLPLCRDGGAEASHPLITSLATDDQPPSWNYLRTPPWVTSLSGVSRKGQKVMNNQGHSHHLGNSKRCRSSTPGTGTKAKYVTVTECEQSFKCPVRDFIYFVPLVLHNDFFFN